MQREMGYHTAGDPGGTQRPSRESSLLASIKGHRGFLFCEMREQGGRRKIWRWEDEGV